MKRNKILSLCVSLLLLLSIAAPAFAAQTITVDPISIMVGGKIFLPIDADGNDVPVFVYNGTTYAPLRALAVAYGLSVGYNAEKNLATVSGFPSANYAGTKGTTQALTTRTTLSVSPINIEVNGAVFQPKDASGAPVAVFVYNGTTYAPLRALAEAYGLTVAYDSEKRLATVDFTVNRPNTINYDPIIDYYYLPFELGHPQYSVDEIQKMIHDDLTLDEAAARISTVADAIQYLHQKGFGSASGDLHFQHSGIEWSVNRSPQTVFDENQGNCGGGSSLLNYLLRNDFDEQGYVAEAGNQGGHIYNYFKQDGVYYFLDLVQIVHGGDYAHGNYRVFKTTDPQEFSTWYISRNHSDLKSDAPTYRLLQYMYPLEGVHLPCGSNSQCRTVLNTPLANILPSEIEETVTLLYVANSKYTPIFRDAPDRSLWPANAR